jgi:ABC-type uncharacterized transport system involved in gliding motility auxiliary subunit
MKLGKTALAAALLFVGLVLVNYLASSLPARFDATADRIYTLSPGTRSLLGKIGEPVAVDYYFSRGARDLPVQYKNYADRVLEMLREYARASRGRMTLNVVDPEPDTPEEEKATAAGIEPQHLEAGGDPFYFGVVATEADQQKAITALTPDREQFLEYDLSELIYRVQLSDKKKLGLITSLPLQASPGNPMTGQGGDEGQYVVQEWQDTFDIVPVEAAATELPAKLDALAVIHPENLTPRLQFAIDQFLLAGKPVFIAVDPASEYFKRQGGQMAMFNGPAPNVSSDLPVLFSGWGIAYDPQKIVGDNQSAMEVQLQDESVVHYPVWLGLQRENFNPQALPTADLSSMLFVEAGSVALRPGVALTLTPLVETSPAAGELDAGAIQFAQPDEIARQIVSTGKKTIAALVTGKFKTAFPGGMPANAKAGPFLRESTGNSTLIVVADTDWLFDEYSIRKMSLFGQTAVEPRNDNLSFAANSLDFLSGSQDLISIRGKGSSLRPFTVVRAMEAKANAQYEEQLTALEAQLDDVQTKLNDLQSKKTEGNRLVASPEETRAIEDFQKQSAKLRGERREIRLALRKNIDALGNRLLAINLLAVPLCVCVFGVWFQRSRKA